MESRAKLFGHPLHPMLIVFPLGLLSAGVIFDVVYFITGNGHFAITSFWMITAGLVGGLLAAVFGLIDWLAIPAGTRARQIGLLHGGGNVIIALLFALAWFLRMGVEDMAPGTFAFILELLGAGLALFTGWLGGELVYRLGMAVDDGANLNAPSSLSGEPAGKSTEQAASARPSDRARR